MLKDRVTPENLNEAPALPLLFYFYCLQAEHIHHKNMFEFPAVTLLVSEKTVYKENLYSLYMYACVCGCGCVCYGKRGDACSSVRGESRIDFALWVGCTEAVMCVTIYDTVMRLGLNISVWPLPSL